VIRQGRDPLTGRKRWVSRQVAGTGRAALKEAKQLEAQPVERQQLKWFLYGAVALLVTVGGTVFWAFGTYVAPVALVGLGVFTTCNRRRHLAPSPVRHRPADQPHYSQATCERP
jgi:hypothetical protein